MRSILDAVVVFTEKGDENEMRKMLTELSTDCFHDVTLRQELEQAMFILPSEVRRKQRITREESSITMYRLY